MALHDVRRLDSPKIEADVCVVGAGAAGISIARELTGQSCRVALLESGDLVFRHRPQFLYLGDNVGTPSYSPGKSRFRMFGGSTTRWGGQCRPLDAIDFEAREGLPYTGWPFGRETLEPYYRRAQSLCNLGPFDYRPSAWIHADSESLHVPSSLLETKIYQFSHPSDFGVVYRDALARAENIDVYFNANVTEIEVDERAANVAGLVVRTFNGRQLSVRARYYVLACGGIENPRLLLASNRIAPQGIGNQHDLVGRFFMDHPYFLLGCYEPALARFDKSMFVIEDYTRVGIEQKANAALSLAEQVLREENLNGGALYLVRRPRYKTNPEYFAPGARSFVHLVDVLRHHELPDRQLGRHLLNIAAGLGDVGRLLARKSAARRKPDNKLALRGVLESTPNRDSRVALGRRKDHFGMPRVEVDWRLNPEDRRGLTRLMSVIRTEFSRLRLGTLIEDHTTDDGGWPRSLTGGKHHMGTTRMHVDPRQGVVDAACRVHGCANLYIAGSSVFPTSGFANPTLTIVALAVRLADELKGKLRGADTPI